MVEKCVTSSDSGMVQYVGGVSSRIFLTHTLGLVRYSRWRRRALAMDR